MRRIPETLLQPQSIRGIRRIPETYCSHNQLGISHGGASGEAISVLCMEGADRANVTGRQYAIH